MRDVHMSKFPFAGGLAQPLQQISPSQVFSLPQAWRLPSPTMLHLHDVLSCASSHRPSLHLQSHPILPNAQHPRQLRTVPGLTSDAGGREKNVFSTNVDRQTQAWIINLPKNFFVGTISHWMWVLICTLLRHEMGVIGHHSRFSKTQSIVEPTRTQTLFWGARLNTFIDAHPPVSVSDDKSCTRSHLSSTGYEPATKGKRSRCSSWATGVGYPMVWSGPFSVNSCDWGNHVHG